MIGIKDENSFDWRVIDKFNIEDIYKIIHLQNLTFHDNRTLNDWIWEYATLYPDYSVFLSLFGSQNNLIGTQGMLPIFLNIKGTEHLSGKSELSLLGSQYRGGNFFKDLYFKAITLCQEKGMNCLWGFTMAGVSLKVHKPKLGFEVYQNIICDSTIVLNLRKANQMISKSKKRIKLIFAYCKNLYGFFYAKLSKYLYRTPKIQNTTRYCIQQQYNSITDLQSFYSQLRKKMPGLIHIEQTELYFHWRITNNPNVKYKCFFVYEGTYLKAYCYLGTCNNEICTLTDFAFEDMETGAFLLRYVLQKVRQDDANYGLIYYMGNMTNPLIQNNFKLLKQFGFLHSKASTTFVVKQIAECNKAIYDIRNWYLSALWLEGFTT